MKKVLFIDWSPTGKKIEINSGNKIRRYYAWTILNEMANKVYSLRKENNYIDWTNVFKVYNGKCIVWVEYGCGSIAHLLAILLSFNHANKLVLNIHDLHMQQEHFNKSPTSLKKLRLQIIEALLLYRANTLIIPWPRLLDYFKPRTKQKIIIMPPGIGEDEIGKVTYCKNKRKTALYFGSMRRKGIIPVVVESFSELKEWDLQLVGPKEGEEIIEKSNVKYLGSVSHQELSSIMSNADIILIPLPNNEYTNKLVPIKCIYALNSCKPVIITKLEGISEFISMLSLDKNVIYVNDWNIHNLKEALYKAANTDIDVEKTTTTLKSFTWERRFQELIRNVLEDSNDRSQIKVI
ncbi:MAG: hypothetical protein JG777_1763 [Clostridia bacterium]|jgi:hypothetical protein|nr:hypothetical protein [Clostridia bacterium]